MDSRPRYTFVYQNMTEAKIVGLQDSATNMLLRNVIKETYNRATNKNVFLSYVKRKLT